MKYPYQSPAVDIWSAGVIFLCILSGRYPFFRAYDDMTSLAQIMSLRGSKVAARVAFKLGESQRASVLISFHKTRFEGLNKIRK